MSHADAPSPAPSHRLSPVAFASWLLMGTLVALSLASCKRSGTGQATTPGAPSAQTLTLGADPAHPDAAVRLSLDHERMTVADRLTLTITLEAAGGREIDFAGAIPDPPSGKLGDFTVAAHTVRTIPAELDRTSTTHTIILEPFLDGAKTVPALSFRITEPGSDAGQPAPATRELASQPVQIAVSPVLPPAEADKAALSPAREPVPTTLAAKRPNYTVVALAAASLAAWLGAFAWARLGAGRHGARPDPVSEARRSLAAIRATLAAAQNDAFSPAAAGAADAGAQIAATVRTYLQRRLDIPAIGATAGELAARLAASSTLPPGLASQTAAMLAALEEQNFAPVRPRAAVLLEHLATAERLVESSAALPTPSATSAPTAAADPRAQEAQA